MSHGEHIRIVGGGRVVHAIDCGDRTVLHLAEGDGGPATVKRTLLADLTQGTAAVEIVRAAHKVYPPQMVVARAFSKLGDPAAAAMFPTSEHFAAWCVSGQAPRFSPRPAAPPPQAPPGALQAIRSAVEKAVGAAAAAERGLARAVSRAGKKVARVERKIAARAAAPGRGRKGAKAKARAPGGGGKARPAGGRKARGAARPARPSPRKAGSRRKR